MTSTPEELIRKLKAIWQEAEDSAFDRGFELARAKCIEVVRQHYAGGTPESAIGSPPAPNAEQQAVERVADLCAEDILETSDADILAEAHEDGINIGQEVEKVRRLFKEAQRKVAPVIAEERKA